jgi:hypothetical protein
MQPGGLWPALFRHEKPFRVLSVDSKPLSALQESATQGIPSLILTGSAGAPHQHFLAHPIPPPTSTSQTGVSQQHSPAHAVPSPISASQCLVPQQHFPARAIPPPIFTPQTGLESPLDHSSEPIALLRPTLARPLAEDSFSIDFQCIPGRVTYFFECVPQRNLCVLLPGRTVFLAHELRSMRRGLPMEQS